MLYHRALHRTTALRAVYRDPVPEYRVGVLHTDRGVVLPSSAACWYTTVILVLRAHIMWGVPERFDHVCRIIYIVYT